MRGRILRYSEQVIYTDISITYFEYSLGDIDLIDDEDGEEWEKSDSGFGLISWGAFAVGWEYELFWLRLNILFWKSFSILLFWILIGSSLFKLDINFISIFSISGSFNLISVDHFLADLISCSILLLKLCNGS